MAKVLITGANGFIGSHIVGKMLSIGCEVYGFVRKSSDLSLIQEYNIPLLYGDINDKESLKEAVKGMDIVIHNAGFASDWGPLNKFLKINFEGTILLAEASSQARVKRFVLMSSTAIHGFGSKKVLDENAPIKTHNFAYSISKWEAEKWLFEFSKSSPMEITAIRPGNVFGPKDHTFIEKYLEIIFAGTAGYINKGVAKTCPTYVGNLVNAISIAAFHPKAVGESFIITDGLDINWKEFTEKFTEIAGVKKPFLSIPHEIGILLASIFEKIYQIFRIQKAPILTKYRIHNGGMDYSFSIQKAKNLLGYEVEFDLDSAIMETIQWYKIKNKIG